MPVCRTPRTYIFWIRTIPPGYGLAIAPSTEQIHHLGSGGWPFGRGVAANINTDWHFVAATTSGTSARVYCDGIDVTTNATQPSGLTAGPDNFSIGRITGAPPANADFFYGTIDEVRVSSQVRSADWISAQYKSMTDSFIDYGETEIEPILSLDFHTIL